MQQKKLTLKQSKWVDETINTTNPTEAVRRVYKVKNNNVAKSIAHENLTKPYLREAIMHKMAQAGLTADHLFNEHKKVVAQDSNLPAKNTALDMAYRLYGLYAPTKTQSFNIDIPATSEELTRSLKQLIATLKNK
ncbi:MAG: hypothetical protein A3J48_02365 [Candidatus Doudnabacteria bacterium RIFCSPHIGHO2_02_FULL_46_11]|uniref:Terminase small subunit n=1 Tax=Candidatus Doudnabacteria bacterium RIFCSPHIGHO2_02_FULL_46_11 TaxID=1817832 RepID=A0A1F5P8N7_9BACT|nr:MAG: hypothetical protein A3J48_02365 [Candidatus Doudnabacteria bacterium RIFCSPHIGHO2_02_FULL_46_11]